MRGAGGGYGGNMYGAPPNAGPAANYSFEVRVDRNVDQPMRAAFTDILTAVQMGFSQLASYTEQQNERINALTNDKRALQQQCQQLTAQLQSAASAAPRAPGGQPGPNPSPGPVGKAGMPQPPGPHHVAPGPMNAVGVGACDGPPPPPPQIIHDAPPAQVVAPVMPAAAVQPQQQAAGGAQNRDAFQAELLQVIEDNQAPVHCVAASPFNPHHVATAAWDGTVMIYDVKQQRPVRNLRDFPDGTKMGGLYCVAFAKTTPRVLGCTSGDHGVYLWEPNTGEFVARLQSHEGEVNCLDFHTSQCVLVTASDDKRAIVWDFQELIPLRTLESHEKEVYGCTFLGQEHQYLVATCSFDQKTRIFDMRDKKVAQTLSLHHDDIIGVSYSSQARLLATASDDGLVGLYDSRMNWRLVRKINTRTDHSARLPENEVKRVSFSHDGAYLAAACNSGVLVFDVRDQQPQQTGPLTLLAGHNDTCFDVAWLKCPDTGARILVSASHDHTLRTWRELDAVG
mmetsp:Transcript_58141/g.138358  ORF Transcript_58141/g.138358 Transcript_58141/m.138358 type:complete len:510 (-) Transcript_58141:113-1642(-)|eukprot:CAMPEP_0178438512 /NCGR_PEP_ID=MMETSP0689_2-20121128/35633_1 /TAXON_ID=160604 /ORGANISM="Amphidinium massartii, Strain CS-259" /LENGTH=509 /DNA_ID=CAMNT_0020060921 /DNA_START=149 /DNA_END=1678 /DNA_ORIENTATION=-